MSFILSAGLWIVRNPVIAALLVIVTITGGMLAKAEVSNLALDHERARLSVQLSDKESENHNLTLKNGVLLDSVTALDAEIALTKKSQDILERTVQELTNRGRNDADRLQQVQSAPRRDDGPVAPVLRRALDGLRD